MRNLISTSVASIAALTVVATAAGAGAAPSRPSAQPTRPVVVRPNAITAGGTTYLYGGGATLPAIAYEGTALAGQAPGVSKSSINGHAAFGYFAGLSNSSGQRAGGAASLAISYCQTGSGFGKKMLGDYDFSNSAPLYAYNPCPAIGVKAGDTNGFSAFSGTAQQTAPDFAGSDAPLSQTEYNNFTAHRSGEPVQTPVIAGAVAIFFNNPDLSTISKAPAISDATICKIFSGAITNWNQIPDFSPALPSRAISVAYRSDGSGTTFSLSNHLHTVCASVLAADFGVSQNFVQTLKNGVVTDYGVLPSPGTVPTNFVGASGNPGVTSTIVNTTGAIGYVEAANAKANLRPSSGVYYFAVHSGAYNSGTKAYDPYADLPTTGNQIGGSGSYVTDEQIPTSTGYGQGATPTAFTTAPVKANCVVLVKPAVYAAPTSGYPILGVTNLDFASTGNNDVADLRALPKIFYYGNSISSNYGSGKITSIDRAGTSPGAPSITNPTATGGTGFSSLQLSSALGTAVSTAAACIGT